MFANNLKQEEERVHVLVCYELANEDAADAREDAREEADHCQVHRWVGRTLLQRGRHHSVKRGLVHGAFFLSPRHLTCSLYTSIKRYIF